MKCINYYYRGNTDSNQRGYSPCGANGFGLRKIGSAAACMEHAKRQGARAVFIEQLTSVDAPHPKERKF